MSPDATMPVTFATPGFYRLALTVSSGLSDLAWRDIYAVEIVAEIATEGAPQGWD
jgi:hypothetical protein